MSAANNSNRQITLYFNPESKLGKQALADAQASKAKVLAINIMSSSVSGTKWAKLANDMGVKVFDLINTKHPVFKNIYGNKEVELSTNDALKILENHPEVLVYPIAERGDRCILFKQSTDMRKLKEPDSKGTNLKSNP